ncbi:hypothetical protein [Dysgonomonas reticulitermitis]
MRAYFILAILISYSMYTYPQIDKKIIPYQVDSVRNKDTILLEELRSIDTIKSERPFIYIPKGFPVLSEVIVLWLLSFIRISDTLKK